MDSSGIKNQSKFLPLRELSPTVLGSLHLQNRNLEELDMLAQKSVQKRLKSIETFKTEPISIEPPRDNKKIERGSTSCQKNKIAIFTLLAKKIKRILQQMVHTL